MKIIARNSSLVFQSVGEPEWITVNGTSQPNGWIGLGTNFTNGQIVVFKFTIISGTDNVTRGVSGIVGSSTKITENGYNTMSYIDTGETITVSPNETVQGQFTVENLGTTDAGGNIADTVGMSLSYLSGHTGRMTVKVEYYVRNS